MGVLSSKKTLQSKAREVVTISLANCLAKTYTTNSGERIAGRNVFEHCQIVGEVALALLDRMPSWLREALFPKGLELIAATHDVGKISPTFQEKIHRGVDNYQFNSYPGLENTEPQLETRWGGHAGTSQATVDRDGVNAGKFIPEILGCHHGYLPNLGGKIATDGVFGDRAWQKQREQCIEQLKGILRCDNWPKIKSDVQAAAIAGLVSVSDWIGSSSTFDNPDKNWQTNDIQQVLDLAGFIQPNFILNLSFKDIFGFRPRPIQQHFVENVIQPGVYVLEAPMGLGKTEAALYAAYQAMASGRATGIYFALPTQLTSEKIHERVNSFLEKIISPDCYHREALLLHSHAWLKLEMGEEGRPGRSWFHARKRGILAPFAVGTIDQALMAVLNVRHGFVRTFGLAGKVVILDEVHTYDDYTGTILDSFVTALKELHCTVIILSATLTQRRRQELINSSLKKSSSTTLPSSEPYPLISMLPKGCSISESMTVKALPDSKVDICLHHDIKKAIDEALNRAEQGQQVLWIENVVSEAQDLYKLLSARSKEINVACGLLHSRFLKADRDNLEKQWVNLYGKCSGEQRQKQGRILIGTQVLEQSLDIDADFLVTRICPTDMLLQRLGRLWRHQETHRPLSTRREAWILSSVSSNEAINDNFEQAFGKSAKVYSPYILYRSLEVWESVANQQSLLLPRDIRSLLEETYLERMETNDQLNRAKYELTQKRGKQERLALTASSQWGKTKPDTEVTTRYSEQDTVEVLLFHSYQHKADKSGTYVKFLCGEEIYLPKKIQNKEQSRLLALKLSENIVRVADYLAPQTISKQDLNWVEGYLYLGNKKYGEALLRVARVQSNGMLKSIDYSAASLDYSLCYDVYLGYQAEKFKPTHAN